MEEIINFLGRVILYGGTSAGVAYLLFKNLGEKWIDSKFAKSLEDHKHNQSVEIQRLRIEIDSMLNGVIKIQEKEFEVLPLAWEKMNDALGQLSALVAPFQQYPDVQRMTVQELDELLLKTEFEDSEKDRIRHSLDKADAYQKAIFWRRLNKVRSLCADFHNFILRNSIFLPSHLKSLFTEISELLWSAMLDKQIGYEASDWKMQNEGWTKVKEKIEPLQKSIEEAIHQRLHEHGQIKHGDIRFSRSKE